MAPHKQSVASAVAAPRPFALATGSAAGTRALLVGIGLLTLGSGLYRTLVGLRIALFVLFSALVSLAAVPILLTAGGAPAFDTARRLRLRVLYRLSPLGVMGCVVAGLSNAALIGLGPAYAEQAGMSVAEISLSAVAAMEASRDQAEDETVDSC